MQPVFDPVWDDDNDTAYMIVDGGLLEIPLTTPLILQSETPAYGPAGTTVTLIGSGYKNGDIATVGGVNLSLSVTDEHTATLVTPAHTDGAAVITVTSLNQQSSSLDPGFIYGAAWPQSARTIHRIPNPMHSPAVRIGATARGNSSSLQ